MPQAQLSGLGLATGSGPVASPLSWAPGRTELVRQQPVALVRSLLPDPPARTHWPRCIARCLDSPGLGQRKEEVPRCRPPRGRASNPREHFPSVPSHLLYACLASSLGTCGTGLCRPGCSAEGASWLDQGSAASPPAPRPPLTGFGIHSLCSQGTLEGRWENPIIFKKKKEDATRRKLQTSGFSSSPPSERQTRGGRASVTAKPGGPGLIA